MKHSLRRIAFIGLALLGLTSASVRAQAIVPSFQDFTNGSSTQDYQFTGLNRDTYQSLGYPGGITGAAWPAPILADGGGSQTFNHVNAVDATDFLPISGDGGGIYSFGSNTTFEIGQSSPLAGMQSLTFQTFLAAGVDAAATDNLYLGLPTLTLTLADTSTVTISSGAGTIFSSTPAVIFGQNTALTDLGFTFDLSGVTQPIESYTLDWSVAQHSITYGMDVTESTAAVPEPSSWAMIALGLSGLVFWTRRRRLALE